ncbi:MAG: Gfo/Idh/MocA family protein, partial [Alphaproteobacteria bacterium]
MTGAAFSPRRRDGGALRVGIVGAGDISAYHLTAWQRAGHAGCVAVCDRDRGRAEARAREFGIDGVYADAGAMLAEADLDILDIATWRDSHAAFVRLGIEHGADILCQKPLAPSLAAAEALVAEAEGRVRLMVNENRRFQPPFRRIGAWLREGAVGDVRQVNMTMHRSGYIAGPDGRRPAVERSPRMGTEPRLLIAETFIHQLDVLRWLVGPLRVVAARGARTEPDMPGETLATVLMETSEGAPVVLAGSFVAPGFGTVVSDRLELIGRDRKSV